MYVTDAGMPGVSDPGERVVRACRTAGLPVEVVPGPSAALAALAALGASRPTASCSKASCPGRGSRRVERLDEIATEPRTVVLFEAPNRVAATLDDLVAACGDRASSASPASITKLHEEVLHGPLGVAAEVARIAEPRGEHVIVVDGLPVVAAVVTDATVEDAVLDALERGLSARDAPRPRSRPRSAWPSGGPTSWRSRFGSGEPLDAGLAHQLLLELPELDPRRRRPAEHAAGASTFSSTTRPSSSTRSR